jgi:hypothetical protein
MARHDANRADRAAKCMLLPCGQRVRMRIEADVASRTRSQVFVDLDVSVCVDRDISSTDCIVWQVSV